MFSLRLPVVDQSETGDARRAALSAARELGFSEIQQGRVGIVASELATNLAKHTPGGEFIIQQIRDGDHVGLELITIDAGPGIADLGRVMRDGFSTAGSQGTGLGAVQRLSGSFDLYSQPGKGSVFVAQLWSQETPSGVSGIEYGVVSVPHPGEEVSGDGWLVDDLGGGQYTVLVVDGLGHGHFAAQAATAALEAYQRNRGKTPGAIVEYCHGALRATRGAAMALAFLDAGRQQRCYAGIGNISGAVVTDNGIRRMVSHDGTVGHVLRRLHEFTYEWAPDSLLIMHSDGLTANWNLEQYPGLRVRHPSVIAGVLYRDAKRRNDDATVVVLRQTNRAA